MRGRMNDMELLAKAVLVLGSLGVASIIWIKWARERRSGVVHLKLNNPTVVVRRDQNPISFRIYSAVQFLLALLWTLFSPFIALL